MTTGKGELGSQGDALLRELAITQAEERSAQVTLAWLALTTAGGDKTAAAGALRTVLEAAGFIPYAPGRPPKAPDGCQKTITNYRRPGA